MGVLGSSDVAFRITLCPQVRVRLGHPASTLARAQHMGDVHEYPFCWMPPVCGGATPTPLFRTLFIPYQRAHQLVSGRAFKAVRGCWRRILAFLDHVSPGLGPRRGGHPGLLPRARRRPRRAVGEERHTSGYTNGRSGGGGRGEGPSRRGAWLGGMAMVEHLGFVH